jgi:hypothetical protein
MSEEIKISFSIKHSDLIEENLNNTIILLLRNLFEIETDFSINNDIGYNQAVDYYNKSISELQQLLEQKRRLKR